MFAPNDMRSCVTVQITDDDVVEQDESFNLILEAPPDLDSAISSQLIQVPKLLALWTMMVHMFIDD